MNRLRHPVFYSLAVLLALTVSHPQLLAQDNGDLFRWDFVTSRLPGPGEIGGVGVGDIILGPGGTITATALDNSVLTLTGSGLFEVDQSPRLEDPRIGQTASGGGTWTLRDSPGGAFAGGIIGSGTYSATELIQFRVAPGTAASSIIDTVGPVADMRAGLMVLRIRFSDGAHGTLTFFTRLSGTPTAIPQLVRVTRGYVEFVSSATTAIHVRR